jgi:hypothetical protein
MDILLIGLSYTYREFLSELRPAQRTIRAEARRRAAAAAAATRTSDPIVVISSDSEEDAPSPKRCKTSLPREASSPEVIVVTDEDGDLRYPEDVDGDVPMHSPDPPIRVDPRNYDPTLEPAPAAVPPEQHASSSRSTLDDPPSNAPDSHFLGFRLCPMEALSPSSRTAFVDEIVNWANQSGAGEERVESALLFMSAIFSWAGNTLGWRRRDRKGKGRAA